MNTLSRHHYELCLDFANTVHWHASDHPMETLHNYEELLSWAHKQEILTVGELDELIKVTQSRDRESRLVFQRGIELREVIYRIVVASIEKRTPKPKDIETLNKEFSIAHQYQRISIVENGYQMMWVKDNHCLDRPLWPITYSAADLLLSTEVLSRIGQCADDRGCGWLFIDWSKNHSRRWCDIKDCGNRAKQRRYYKRLHK